MREELRSFTTIDEYRYIDNTMAEIDLILVTMRALYSGNLYYVS